MTRDELQRVFELAFAELDRRGIEVRDELAKLEPMIEDKLARFERATKIQGLAALVHLEAAALEAERWASEQGSTYSCDPGITVASAALRFHLGVGAQATGPVGPQGAKP